MADFTQKQYLDLAGLGLYDEKIKAHIKAQDDALTTSIGNVASDLVDEAATARAAELAINNKIGTVAEGKTVVGMIGELAENAENGVNDLAERLNAIEHAETGILATAKAYTDAEVLKEKNRAEGAEADLDTAIKAEVSRATSAEGTLQSNIQSSLQDAKNYTDTEVTAEEDRAKAAEQAIQDVIGNTDNMPASTIIESINNEVVRATGAEESLGNRLTKVETFFETAEGETLDAALDTLVELQKYLDEEGKVADQMLLDIAANAKAIEDEAKRADAAEKANAKDIADLKAAVGEGGSVGAQIDAKINALDSTAAHTAGADGLALNVAIVDGKLTSISGSIAAETYDAFGAAAAAQSAAAGDATTKANTAESNAKSYADTELAKVYGAVQPIAKSDIEALFG